MRIFKLILCLLMSLLVVACGSKHHPPVADAGPDQNITTGSLVTLDGSASSDIDGDRLVYSWSFVNRPEGSTAVLSDSSAVRPTFTVDQDGSYILELVVNDGRSESTPDRVTVTAATANSAPVANAGPDQNVATGSLVTLDGNASSDADGDPLSYSWSLTSVPAGSGAVLSDTAAATPTFTADLDGDYVVQLIVSDGTVASAPESVTITAATANSAPVANAGPDQTIATGRLVTLDGSASSDADGDPLGYTWSLISVPAGSGAVLSDSTAASPTFTADLDGDYVVQLIVNDGTVDSTPESVTITASPTWGPLELVIDAAAVPGIDNHVGYPVPVRFDANTIHLYFAGYAFKAFANVPSAVFRIISTDNGATWSAPERLTQLEGNYQSYPSVYDSGKLLLVWHDGSHAELYHTDLASAADVPVVPSKYVDYSSISKEVIWTSSWSGKLVGMWHTTASGDSSPFVATMEATTATLSGISWPFGGAYYIATPISADKALVLTDSGLFRSDFDGSAFSAPNEQMPFPAANAGLNYGGATFHYAALDQASGYIYFMGYNQDTSKAAIYRVKLLQ
ncbi:MAG: hypothetical protein EG822_17025 [Deltaproteobacteria bacterium]|nr:hypothetical protein [Deltaproteobacteria bacterium]TLN03017.1 MAG: hypothetical protein FDZ73_09495 [bacterium]